MPVGLTPAVPEIPTTTKRIQSSTLRDPWLAAITSRKLHTPLNQRGSLSFLYLQAQFFPGEPRSFFSGRMGSLSCYEVCFACGSHSTVESMRVATCFYAVTEHWPWEMPARPRFSFENSDVPQLHLATPAGGSS